MPRISSRLLFAALVFAAAVAAGSFSAGCSKTTKSGDSTNTGLLTGYELNNPDDFADQRRDRPDYRDFE